MNARQLHSHMVGGLSGTARQISVTLGVGEKSIRRCLGELEDAGLALRGEIAPALNGRPSGSKPRYWRASPARAFSEG